MGDIEVEGRVISTAFGDTALLEDTLRRLADATSPSQHVNGIAGYSALWLTSLDSLFLHSADRGFLESQSAHILQILARLDQDIDASNRLSATSKSWGFVDWAPGLYGLTPKTRIGTNLRYLRGFGAGARLLQALNDPNAARYAARSKTLSDAARAAYLDPVTSTDRARLFQEFENIRSTGIGCDREESILGGICFGAAIRIAGQPVVAAVSISTPVVRMTAAREEETCKAVLEAAVRIAAS